MNDQQGTPLPIEPAFDHPLTAAGTEQGAVPAAQGIQPRPSGTTSALLELTMQVLLSAVVVVAFLHFGGARLLNLGGQSVTDLVIADTQALMQEVVAKLANDVANGRLPANEQPKRARAFADALQAALQPYAEQGMTVLNVNAVAAAPQRITDITGDLRRALTPDWFSAQSPATGN